MANFFEVDINYFQATEDKEQELLEQAKKNKLIREVALRASMYSEETVLAILTMMEYIEQHRAETDESKET